VVLEPARPHTATAVQLAAYGLTRRENEVATRILRGESNRVIAGALHLTEYTVHDHIKSIFDKTGVRSRASSPGGCWPHPVRGEPAGPREPGRDLEELQQQRGATGARWYATKANPSHQELNGPRTGRRQRGRPDAFLAQT